jgi:thiol:disulfide interchange protein DsbA
MRFVFALFLVLAASLSFAQEAAQYQAGKHYEEIANPVRTSNPNKIEVTEVFWYGCGHCYNFYPLMESWAEKQPEDVAVKRSPAIWRDAMETHARIYYTAKALGKLDEIHGEVFDAMHNRGKRLTQESEIAELFAKHGVDKETFRKTFNSFGVKSQVQQADARQRGFGVTGTPTVVVEGRYRVSGRNVSGGTQEMLKVVDYLVEKVRQEK